MRRAMALAIGLLFALAAQAEEGSVDLEDADQEQTRSLDSYPSGEPRSLDSVDTGDGEDLDAADTGGSVDLDTAEEAPQSIAAPAPAPEVGSAEQRAEALRLREEAVATARRLESANAAYSQMLARGYPTGEERAKIISEREEALKAHQHANARYGALLEKLGR